MSAALTAGERSQRRWDARGTRALLRAARAAAANSRWTRADAARRVPEARAARVVYYGAPAAARRSPPPRGLPRRFVLCASRLAEYKGVDLLVFAQAINAARGLAVPLVLCGSDHSSGGLTRFARRLGVDGLVVGLGRVPHGRVQALMRRADFLVLPSRRDSLGGVVLEAFAAGRPVVAARVGGVPELARHGREALLVPAKDPAALARAVARLWRDGPLRRRLARGARARAARFTWLGAMRTLARLAGARPGGRVGVLVWEDGRDQTARVYLANAARALRALGYRPAAAAWDGRGRAGRAAAVSRLSASRPDACVVFFLRYRHGAEAARAFTAGLPRPAVYLC